MVKIRRAYEVLFLGLFLFFLLITDLRYLKGWPVSLFLEATPLVAVSTALTTHTIYRNLVWGLVIIADHDDARPGLVQLDVPVRHPAPLLRLDRQPPEHQADDRGQPLPEDLRDQVLHPRRHARDGRLWIIPTLWYAPGQIVQAYRESARLAEPGFRLGEAIVALLAGRRWSLGLGKLVDARSPVQARGVVAPSARPNAIAGRSASSLVARPDRGRAGRGRSTPSAPASRRRPRRTRRGNSTLQIGLLDPIALTVRSMTTSVLPTVHMASEGIYTEPREYWQAWVVGLIFFGFLVANWWIPRFFCRAICPLGALLGIFSRFSLWRIDRDPVRCTDCDLCLKSCEGASDPHKPTSARASASSA